MALNEDDAVQNSKGMTIYGGVVPGHTRAFIFGYSYALGVCTISMTELWAKYNGLELSFSRGSEILISDLILEWWCS